VSYSSAWSMTNRTARALNSSSHLFGMMRTTFPRKKVCIKPGAIYRSLEHRVTPRNRLPSSPQSHPRNTPRHPQPRPHRPLGQAGSITLRLNGRPHHIGIGRIHYRTRVLILVHDLDIRIINAATGELLRQLTLDPTKDYQPTGARKGPTRKKPQT
jgi:hypothetical protein